MDFHQRNSVIARHEDDELDRYLDARREAEDAPHRDDCECFNCELNKEEQEENPHKKGDDHAKRKTEESRE